MVVGHNLPRSGVTRVVVSVREGDGRAPVSARPQPPPQPAHHVERRHRLLLDKFARALHAEVFYAAEDVAESVVPVFLDLVLGDVGQIGPVDQVAGRLVERDRVFVLVALQVFLVGKQVPKM